jgi:ABC-2 type transport system permease protein
VIWSIAGTHLARLRRDKSALVLTFILPLVFFSIFAGIFGGGSSRVTTRRISIAVVDEDGSPNSKRFVEALKAEKSLRILLAPAASKEKEPPAPFDAATAEKAVREGDVTVALIVPKGFGAVPIRFGPASERPKLTILSDSSDPIAAPLLSGLLQKVVMTGMPDRMAESGMEAVDRWGGGLTAEQRRTMDENLKAWRASGAPASAGAEAGGADEGLVSVTIRDLLGETKKNPVVAFYAAGIGVMFLLFTASHAAGGALIEEVESGTLDRILSTRVSMTRLLLGKLLYLVALASSQLVLMFVWGALVFGLELVSHLPGFFIMTLVTAVAVSCFGLLLAAVCKTRMQLVALANLTILIMSAVGGSMFPRFLMPEKIQKLGLVTLNAWALDGFLKVFWREEPLLQLWPQVAVLLGASLVLFAIARRVARRWEIA